MEITLTLDEELVERARTCAERRQTTLDHMVAELLRREGERLDAIEAWVQYTREHAGRSEPGWRFNREEIYDRRVLD
ncbi:MAG: hypothetical protein HYU66_04580 [Armatimonadetes bacterium]|nr:hypothetical protein [Armatimonadota bacterium]